MTSLSRVAWFVASYFRGCSFGHLFGDTAALALPLLKCLDMLHFYREDRRLRWSTDRSARACDLDSADSSVAARLLSC